ncbi:MAG: 50S ribosomal protein L9 [Planctomycetaceae bacterium]|nr:50S ribosomal protein L9 [Planctomycetaceae bacterium]
MPRKRPERVRSADRRSGVELLLTENIPSLGKQGDIVKVKPGYARNYLLPQGLGTVATAGNRRAVELHRQRQQAVLDARLANLRKLAGEVSKYSVTLEANATEEGHLYGSIGSREISDSLQKAGYSVAPEQVKLEGPLKELGMYTVKVALHPEVESDVKVWVVPVASIS